MADVEQQENGEQDLWSSILSDVQSSATRKLRAHKSILLLGNDESGKSTLISKIRGKEDEISKGHGLEYTYLDVHDEELDDYTRLNVWILDGDARNKTLLKYALTPENANDSLVVLVVDSSKPWTIMDSLHSWTEVLREHIHSLKLTPTQLNEMEEKIARQFQEYVDPEEGGSDENKRRSGTGIKDEEKVLLPLDEDVLVDNLGLPVLVLVTKTDCMETLEKERDYREEHFDFIQQHIRRYCLKYGAALFYTSVKENKNCNLFLKYILHRIYGLPFNSSALVVDKDSVFIPSGWDSMKKINIMNEHLKGIHPDDNFDDHITKPLLRKPLQEKEIAAEEEQEFLAKQQQLLLKNPPSATGGMARQQPDISKPRTPGSPATRIPDRRPSGGSPSSVRPKVDSMKGPTTPGATTNEGVLANFFNSLLNKKTGGAPGTPQGRGVPSVRSDAAAELDRMNRSKRIVGQSGSSEDSSSKS